MVEYKHRVLPTEPPQLPILQFLDLGFVCLFFNKYPKAIDGTLSKL